jgi:hypothetical protein
LPAAKRSLRSAWARRSWRSFAKAVLIFVSPKLAEHQARRRMSNQVPDDTTVFARTWLDEFAAETRAA